MSKGGKWNLALLASYIKSNQCSSFLVVVMGQKITSLQELATRKFNGKVLTKEGREKAVFDSFSTKQKFDSFMDLYRIEDLHEDLPEYRGSPSE